MLNPLEVIADKEYLGRVIIVGKVEDNTFVSYAITGRSPSSQARRIVLNSESADVNNFSIMTEPTDKSVLEKGISALLIYDCIRIHEGVLMVSNGAQTDILYETVKKMKADSNDLSPSSVLHDSFKEPHLVKGNEKTGDIDLSSFEPDHPNYTPRISAVINGNNAAMHIVYRDDKQASITTPSFSLCDGISYLISTYTGRNVPDGEVLPSFKSEPLIINGTFGTTPRDVTNAVYDALGPKQLTPGILKPDEDFRVGVATVFYNQRTNNISVHINNRHERK